jgi:hypothetical protein
VAKPGEEQSHILQFPRAIRTGGEVGIDAYFRSGRQAAVEVGGELFFANGMAAESEKPHLGPPVLRSPGFAGLQSI